jgi:hypothetical protein
MKVQGGYSNTGNSDFTPAKVSNSYLSDFQSKKLGMFLSYALPTYASTDQYGTAILTDTPSPSTFTAPANVNSAQWVLDAISAGADYVILTMSHIYGFNICPYSAPYSSGTTYDSGRGVLSVPVYNNYNVSSCPSSDQTIVEKFVAQCRASNIKFGFYYNVALNLNVRRGTSLIDGSYDQTKTYSLSYDSYKTYVLNELEYITRTYQPDIMWLDSPHRNPRYQNNVATGRRFQHDIYNTIKRTKFNCLVTINLLPVNNSVLPTGTDATIPPYSWTGTEMLVFPTDIISFEYSRAPASAAEYTPSTTHYNQNYYIPREVISTVFVGGAQYFGCNDNFGTLKSTAVLQSEYDFAKGKGAPYLLSVAVNKAGNIPSNQKSLFATIVK